MLSISRSKVDCNCTVLQPRRSSSGTKLIKMNCGGVVLGDCDVCRVVEHG